MKPTTSFTPLPSPPCCLLAPLEPLLKDFLGHTRDYDFESETGPVDPLPGPSTPPHQSTSTRTPAAPKLSLTKEFDTVPETPKLSYEQWPKWDYKPVTRYSEHGFA